MQTVFVVNIQICYIICAVFQSYFVDIVTFSTLQCKPEVWLAIKPTTFFLKMYCINTGNGICYQIVRFNACCCLFLQQFIAYVFILFSLYMLQLMCFHWFYFCDPDLLLLMFFTFIYYQQYTTVAFINTLIHFEADTLFYPGITASKSA